MGGAFEPAGGGVNVNLVRAAALLHDIKRREKDHAGRGAAFLKARGYEQTADIVAVHMQIETIESAFPTEAELVYLADKMVMGRRFVTLQERFAAASARHQENEEAVSAIIQRREQAEKIKKKLERAMGRSLEEMFPAEKMIRLENQISEAGIDA